MSFTYTSGIPIPTNSPSQDVGNMQQNTTTINNWVQTDHIGFNNVQGGQHKQITFSANEAAPGLPNSSVAALFANLSNSQSWPFWQNGAGTVQLLGGVPSAVANGYTFLPGGLILQWGTVSPVVNQTLTPVNFNTNMPNNVFCVIVTEKRTNSPNNVDTVYINSSSSGTPGTFSYYATTTGTGFASFSWIAIGN